MSCELSDMRTCARVQVHGVWKVPRIVFFISARAAQYKHKRSETTFFSILSTLVFWCLFVDSGWGRDVDVSPPFSMS